VIFTEIYTIESLIYTHDNTKWKGTYSEATLIPNRQAYNLNLCIAGNFLIYTEKLPNILSNIMFKHTKLNWLSIYPPLEFTARHTKIIKLKSKQANKETRLLRKESFLSVLMEKRSRQGSQKRCGNTWYLKCDPKTENEPPHYTASGSKMSSNAPSISCNCSIGALL
jgi:hypothetical protein